MQIGKLRHLVTIERPVETRDRMKGQMTAWVAAGTAWADIKPLSGRLLDSAKSFSQDVSHQITLRYMPSLALTPSHRLRYGQRLFTICAPLDVDERNRELSVFATETRIPAAQPRTALSSGFSNGFE